MHCGGSKGGGSPSHGAFRAGRWWNRGFSYVMIGQAFRPGVVDLPAGQSEAALATINVQGYGEFQFGDFDAGLEAGDIGDFTE